MPIVMREKVGDMGINKSLVICEDWQSSLFIVSISSVKYKQSHQLRVTVVVTELEI